MTLRTAHPPVRTLVRWLTIVQGIGYTLSLLFVWLTTRMTPVGVVARYRGTDPNVAEGSLQFAKSFAEMLTITHTHVLALATIFALSGLCLAFCERPSVRWRRFLIAEPFGAIIVSFASMLLMRYVHPRFAWLLGLSSGTMAVAFYIQIYWILREVGIREPTPGS